MHNSRLLQLFEHLREQEFRELKQFVRSPFHNQREDVVQLFDFLRRNRDRALQPEQLFAAAYPGRPFDARQLTYVQSYLLQVIEEYFTISEMRKDTAQRQLLLVRSYRRHGLEAGFRKQVRRLQRTLQVDERGNLAKHHVRYQLAMEEYDLQKNRRRDASLNLHYPTEQLDIFLLGSRLRQACTMLAHERLSEVHYQDSLLTHLIAFIEAPEQVSLLEVPAIALYYYCYKSMLEENDAHFQRLRELIQRYRQQFDVEEQLEFYIAAINYGIRQLNQGRREYVRQTFELYREGLQEEVFIERGEISQFNFKNIIALGLGLQEYDWVEQFLHSYKPFLEATNREQNYNYNLAKLYYEKQEFDKAMQLLQEVKYEDVLPNLTAKILLLKIYYELGEKEVLYSFLHSFERLVRRQRRLGYHKQNYLNLILTVRRLLHLNPFDRTASSKLRSNIEGIEALPEKQWLLRQLT